MMILRAVVEVNLENLALDMTAEADWSYPVLPVVPPRIVVVNLRGRSPPPHLQTRMLNSPWRFRVNKSKIVHTLDIFQYAIFQIKLYLLVFFVAVAKTSRDSGIGSTDPSPGTASNCTSSSATSSPSTTDDDKIRPRAKSFTLVQRSSSMENTTHKSSPKRQRSSKSFIFRSLSKHHSLNNKQHLRGQK